MMFLKEAQGHENYYKRKWNAVHDYFNVSLKKNAGFSKQDHNSLIKGCRQWKEITLSHCITYLGFKYEKLSHEERHINSAFDEKGRIKISILSFVIDLLSGKASLFARSLHADEVHRPSFSYISS